MQAHDREREQSYIEHVTKLTAGLRWATEKKNLAQISQYEALVERLLLDLANQTISTELGLAMKKLKQQHQQTSTMIDKQLESVKNELFNLKKSKNRMKAYTPSSTQHISIKA